jgi:hypothetical protein
MIQAGSASSASPCRQPALSGSRRSVSLITSCQDDAKPCRAKSFALTIGGLLGVGPTAACNAAPWELNRSCKNLSALAVLAALLSTVKPQPHACPRDAHGAIGIGKAETGDCDSRIPIEAVELRIREVDVVGKLRISVGLSRIRFVGRQGTVLIDQLIVISLSEGDYHFLVRNLLFYLEDRRPLVWADEGQFEIARVLFVPGPDSTRTSRLYDEIKQINSRYRNLLTEHNRNLRRLREQRKVEGRAEDMRAAVAAKQEAYAGPKRCWPASTS